MIKRKSVYVVAAFFKNYEEENFSSPSEEFLCDTYEEALALKKRLEQDYHYDEVLVGDEPEEREALF